MEVQDWGGGLTQHEVEAIEKIKANFQASDALAELDRKDSKTISLAEFKKSAPSNPMFPWKGFSGFRLVDPRGSKEGEFDLVIITHCNVLIIELKDWNNHKVTSSNNRWYLGSKDMGKSPVSITRNKKFLLDNILKRYKSRFSNKGYIPFVHFLVVMTGNADFSKLNDEEKKYTISLDDFLKMKNEKEFDRHFRPHPASKVLNKDFIIFDEIFGGSNVKPKSIKVNGYVAEDEPAFQHPNKIYNEYFAYSEHSKNDQVLLRRWDFSKIKNPEAQTSDGRFKLVSREYEVLQHIKGVNEELYSACLNYKTVPQKSEMTVDHTDLFDLMPSQLRFNQFIGQTAKQISIKDRIDYVKLLLHKFVDLHNADIAHRDLGKHSVWLSADKKVSLSGFATAFFPKKGTVGDIRDILTVSTDLVENTYPIEIHTAYQLDVRALAVLSWHILQAKRLSNDSIQSFKQELERDDEWYSIVIKQALSEDPYINAKDFLEAFNEARPTDKKDFSFDKDQLEPFYHNISHYRQFREDEDFIVETDEKEVYLSNGRIVKAWLNTFPVNEDYKARILFDWLQRISNLKQLSPKYIPHIHEFGVATKSGSLYMVSDFVEDGVMWSELKSLDDKLTLEHKLGVINQFIHAIEHLHGIGVTHGDLHPENIKISPIATDSDDIDYQLYLFDALDFNSNGSSNLNYEYAPSHAENATTQMRDIFAVMKMSCELLGVAWGKESAEFPDIAEVISTELSDLKSGFVSLERFKDALQQKSIVQMIEIGIGNKDSFDTLEIYPENDELFFQFEKSKNQEKNDILIKFIGLGGLFKAFYSVTEKKFTHVLPPINRDHISAKDRRDSQSIISIGMRLTSERRHNLTSLNKIILEDTNFTNALDSFIKQLQRTDDAKNQNTEYESNATSETVEITDKPSKKEDSYSFTVKQLWQAILNTETEALPYVTATDSVVWQDEDKVYVPYNGEVSPLDQFNNDDIVQALGKDVANDKTFVYGNVDIKKSSLNELHFKSGSIKRNNTIAEDTIIYIQSKQSKVSFNRRKNALSRILDGEAVINNLYEYFDTTCELPATHYNSTIGEEDFKRYDRPNDYGQTIRLNTPQREAFEKILKYGPVSLLQGPPGTGKTEFIAAFVHYLFEKQGTQNILLVSQSHQAVNTAAERIRRHCRRLDTELEVVRFSNRSRTVSSELLDVFSENLQNSKYELLKAEKIERIQNLGLILGLEEDYLRKRAQIHFDIGQQIKRYNLLLSDKDNGKKDIENKEESKLLKTIEQNIESKIIQTNLDIDLSLKQSSIEDIYAKLIFAINKEYSVEPKESSEAGELIQLTEDMLDSLSNERTNFGEFLARSRQLVVGTCVGMGQSHIGINENIYDWVIIDEAARSISSELAIAMQSGKRILLVGDHKQLPPIYSQEHKLALARRLGIPKRGEELDDALGSDFERVFQSEYGKHTCATLKTQYRMAPAIGNLVSYCFYDGLLENGKQETDIPDIYNSVPKELEACVSWLDTSSLPNAYHTGASNGSSSNRVEIDIIIKLLQELQNDDELLSSDMATKCLKEGDHLIGVICMYAEQKRLLRKKFNENTWDDNFRKLVKIDTVDSYQGKENRIIVVSLTRFDKQLTTGFLHLPNRTNVSLSRAMDKLVIVGATKTWESPKNKHTPLAKVLSYIKENDDVSKYNLVKLSSNKRGRKQ
ncbi:AAA domain-containing protein [uncultured Psychrobacter sp.]|uniref:AAA domain-containing protein n=1 Tax=uncultured Psychrobacter sp. TaxID=259303 RepID=UPI003457949D